MIVQVKLFIKVDVLMIFFFSLYGKIYVCFKYPVPSKEKKTKRSSENVRPEFILC